LTPARADFRAPLIDVRRTTDLEQALTDINEVEKGLGG
jgi:hypothetical protein